MNVKHGIDISDDNPVTSWKAVADSGFVDFVMIQITYGLHSVDDTAMDKMMGAKSVGLPFGFYHYFYPRLDPKVQAEHFYSNVIALCGGFKGQLIPWCDCEESDGYGATVVAQQTSIFQGEIGAKIGYRNVATYSGLYFAQSLLSDASVAHYKLVVADYGSLPPDPQAPNFSLRPTPVGYSLSNIVGWQYTDKHLVPGFPAAVDGTMLDFDECLIG